MGHPGQSRAGHISAGNELTPLSTRDATGTFWIALGAPQMLGAEVERRALETEIRVVLCLVLVALLETERCLLDESSTGSGVGAVLV
jgi:hypothetical protein